MEEIKNKEQIAIAWFEKCMKARNQRDDMIIINQKLRWFVAGGWFIAIVMIVLIFMLYTQNVNLRKKLYDANYRNEACQLLYDNGYRTTQEYDWSKL